MKTTHDHTNPVTAAAAIIVEGMHGRASSRQVARAKGVIDRAFTVMDRILEHDITRLEAHVGIGRGDGSQMARMIRLQGALAFAKARGLDVYLPGKGPGGRLLLDAKRRPTKAAPAKPKRRGSRAR